MGYRSLVKAQVNKAFSLIGDLAEDITLSMSTASAFNFATNEPTISSATPVVIKAVLLNRTGVANLNNAEKLVFLCKSADITSPDTYDTLSYDNSVWNIQSPCKNNGYTTEIEAIRQL